MLRPSVCCGLGQNSGRENMATWECEIMKTGKMAVMATISALALTVLTTGCDRTISETETEKVKSDGTVEKTEKRITESPDGTLKKEEKKSTDRP
jgi:hypothetical protein